MIFYLVEKNKQVFIFNSNILVFFFKNWSDIMGLRNVIEDRRSIRQYNDKDLSKDTINDLLDCGRLAPSAKNRQPWFFVVVKNDMKNKIADLMINWCNNIDLASYEKKMKCPSSVEYTSKVIKEANTLILVFREKDDNWVIGDNLSIGACIENILLRATDLGIGSLWIRDTDCVEKEIEALFNYENLELNSAIALGYTDTNPKPRPRKELKDIVVYY